MIGKKKPCTTHATVCYAPASYVAAVGAQLARTAWVWTEEKRVMVQKAVRDHPTVAELAAAHGLKTRCVFDAINRGIIRRTAYRRPAQVVQFISRTCLCCGKAFNAETRFLRSCEPCRAKGSPLGDWGMGCV